ncbi:hypothetical protein CY34DRAFT_160847 [Suillus luteus UH-Slu-Lm8-n1]|uniref:Unplaced genomic scaffold CY34scaffold_116, whole genome shotgun sequence n=1 Tax=Suillus luteus UH-Slu-Lm8-n1 TaxID=930992 RepID=A0A0D0B6K5_9AGAM|nr:hypothetical protein CY34DRAFT_160847 [Suillus luteus UH-Slu-Lm8-n1]
MPEPCCTQTGSSTSEHLISSLQCYLDSFDTDVNLYAILPYATSPPRPCCIMHSTCHISAASNIAHAVPVPRHRGKYASSHLLPLVRNLRVSISTISVTSKVCFNLSS